MKSSENWGEFDEVNVNKTINITRFTVYEYDNSPLNGYITLNDTTTKENNGSLTSTSQRHHCRQFTKILT